MKTNSNNSTGWDPRKSLNILKSLISPHSWLPKVDEDGDEEMEIDEEAVEKLCDKVGLIPLVAEGRNTVNVSKITIEQVTDNADIDMEEGTPELVKKNESIVDRAIPDAETNTQGCSNSDDHIHHDMVEVKDTVNDSQNGHINCASPPCLSVVPDDVSPILKSPTPSVSPRLNSSRKSLRTSSTLAASQKRSIDESKLEAVNLSLTKSRKSGTFDALATQTSKNVLATTEHLAASLYRGLEIIDSHRKSSAFRRSSFRFSCKPAELKSILLAGKVDVGVQTFCQDNDLQEEDSEGLFCKSCKRMKLEDKDTSNDINLQLVPIDGPESADKSKVQVPKVSS